MRTIGRTTPTLASPVPSSRSSRLDSRISVPKTDNSGVSGIGNGIKEKASKWIKVNRHTHNINGVKKGVIVGVWVRKEEATKEEVKEVSKM